MNNTQICSTTMQNLTANHSRWPYLKISFSKEHHPLPSFWAWAQNYILPLAPNVLTLGNRKTLLGFSRSQTTGINSSKHKNNCNSEDINELHDIMQ